jgi:hypothetical protein
MTLKASNNKNILILLTIALILLVTNSLFLMSDFSQANTRTNNKAIFNQDLRQSAFAMGATVTNETNSMNVTNSYSNYSLAPIKTDPVSLDTPTSPTYTHLDMTGFFFSPLDSTNRGQIAASDSALQINEADINATIPISLDASNFVTYTYSGFPVQQPDSTQFIFSFPNNTNQGQLAGSDALSLNNFTIQKMDFDSAFVTPQINAGGFDEMVIFATSDTSLYKGTEFGIRMDLRDGFIYGYIQEPNDNYGDVNFQMLALMPNDGIMHHYTLIRLGSEVLFSIDGSNTGYLTFPSNTDYSSLSFSILAVVHRFTDQWDSSGDNMIAGNFSLNQQ